MRVSTRVGQGPRPIDWSRCRLATDEEIRDWHQRYVQDRDDPSVALNAARGFLIGLVITIPLWWLLLARYFG
jgi:hypothetical protein